MKERVIREATAEEASVMLAEMQERSRIARKSEDALREAFPSERLAEIIAKLPPDDQERIRREFAEPPVRRRYKIKVCRRKQ